MHAHAPQSSAKRSAKSNTKKGSKRRIRFLMVVLLCFMSWAGVTVWDQFGKLHDKSDVVSGLEEQLAQAKKVNEDTKREIRRLNDNEYLEQIIRRDMHYKRTGETDLTMPKAAQ